MENQTKNLQRSRENRIVAGILGGIGEHFKVDPTLVRIVFAVLLLSSGFALILLYLILWFVIPEAPQEEAGKQNGKYASRVRAVKIFVIIVVALVAISGILVCAKFFYHNVMVPWPYRHELKNCLREAENKSTVEEMDFSRYQCFRTYPHFL